MTKKQQQILDNLAVNHCVISDAIDEVCSRQDFEKFLDDKEFRAEVKNLEKKRDDFVRMAQMNLIESGDSKLTLEYIKELSKTSGEDVLGTIQRETMVYIIETAKNNTDTVDVFQRIFSCTKYKANQMFTEVLANNDLESPTARSKKREDNLEKSLFRRFQRKELSELQMYEALVEDALEMSQFSNRDDVKINAGKLVVVYMDKLEQVQERQRREAEQDETNLIDSLDAQLSGVHPSEIEELRDHYRKEVLGIEVTADVE